MPIPVYVPVSIARQSARLLRSASRKPGPLTLRLPSRTRGPYTNFYRAYSPWGDPSRSPGLYSWNRRRLPLYGTAAFTIPVERLELPDDIAWEMEGPLPEYLPQLSLQYLRNTRVYDGWITNQSPDMELQVRFPPPRSWRSVHGAPRAEPVRARMDNKRKSLYPALLSAINRSYGTLTEYGDLLAAAHYSHGSPTVFLHNLAMNEAVDRAYGTRARYLREKVYRQNWYRLPIGLDAIGTLGRMWF